LSRGWDKLPPKCRGPWQHIKEIGQSWGREKELDCRSRNHQFFKKEGTISIQLDTLPWKVLKEFSVNSMGQFSCI
jgi:hypothetical protein